MLKKLSIFIFTLLLAACNNNVKQGSIGSLAGQQESLREDDTEIPDLNENQAVVEYSRFIRLFDTVSYDAMRRDGMSKMARLQLNYKDTDNIPLAQVISLFENLLDDYPTQRNDRLLYQLSREYEESGERDAALSSLNRLVKKYPNTKFYDEAQFRRGEILFSKRRYVDSEQAYKQVVGYRKLGDKSIYYEQSVYKQGWAQFKQSKYQLALDSFLHLLDLHSTDGDLRLNDMSSSEREFVEDAMRAINLSFSYQAGPISAAEYFSNKQRRPYEYRIFSSLAEFYLDKKHYADSVKTYRLFVTANEVHHQSPAFLLRVIDIYEQGGFPDLLLESKKDYVQRYHINNPIWTLYKPQSLSQESLALEKNLRQLARHYHTLAQQSKSKLNYREAQRWYRTWLDSFPNNVKAWEMNFLFAEILNEDKQYESAVLQYERTAYDYTTHPKSSEAGYAALLAYANREQQLSGQQKNQWHVRSIESAIRFSGVFPKHPEANKVITQAVENLYQIGDYKKAHSIAKKTVVKIRQATLLASLWTAIAHIEFEWKDFIRAEKSYAKAISYLPETSPERKALVKKEAVAVYKQGEISREKGDLKSAVKHFSRVKQVSAETGLIANAEFDAAAALIALRDWGKAAVVLEGFRRQNPEHKLQAEVTRKLAVVYLEKGDTKRASLEFEKVSMLPGERSYQLESLWQAAELSDQSGDTTRAQTLYSGFVKRFPSPLERSIEARQRLVELFDRQDNKKMSSQWRVSLVNADAKGGGARTERTRYLAAKSSFVLAEPVFDRYRKVKLTVPLKKSLKKKRQRMDEALKFYGRAASYKVPEVLTAATYRIAEIYQDLGLAIYNSERPTKLNEEELEQYDILLEEQAYPFEEKAIDFHEINVARLADGLDGVWIWKSLEQLKGFLPVRYDKKERIGPVVNEIY